MNLFDKPDDDSMTPLGTDGGVFYELTAVDGEDLYGPWELRTRRQPGKGQVVVVAEDYWLAAEIKAYLEMKMKVGAMSLVGHPGPVGPAGPRDP